MPKPPCKGIAHAWSRSEVPVIHFLLSHCGHMVAERVFEDCDIKYTPFSPCSQFVLSVALWVQ